MALVRRTEGSTKETRDIQMENLEEREYEARLVAVADLGLQVQEYKGEVKNPAQQISLGLEIVGETYTVDGEEKPRLLWSKPFNIYRNLTEKGNELKYYSIFDPSAEDGDTPDWDSQIGKACSVYIVHSEDKKDKSKLYDNIGKIVAIPAKYQESVPPASITDLGVGNADDPDNPVNKVLYGLTKFVFDKRIGSNTEESAPNPSTDGDSPY